ncbi:MAG TPA: hypothetical protein VNO86_05070 [Candidatus Binatia bacterium]|nr:hypothetical protein [Candidatus Binatia bacterium]
MTTIRDPRRGEVHRGRSVDAIVRRVWGRRAYVRWSPAPENPYDLVVQTDRYGTHVLAEVIVEGPERDAGRRAARAAAIARRLGLDPEGVA